MDAIDSKDGRRHISGRRRVKEKHIGDEDSYSSEMENETENRFGMRGRSTEKEEFI